MRYVSTRGDATPRRFYEILLEGLAPDGGLAVPQRYPRFAPAEFAALRPLSYRDLAFAVLVARPGGPASRATSCLGGALQPC